MFRTWEEVYQSPEFKRLSPEDQERARVSYFASEIAPFVPPERLGEAADAFDRRWAQVRPTEYAPSRGLLRPASDLLLEGAAQVSGGVGKMIDLAVPDVAPGGTIVPERLGDAPVIGRALPKFMQEARVPDVVRSTVDRAAAHVLTPLAGLYEGAFGEVPEGHPLESGSYRLASMKRGVGGGIQAVMEWLGIDSRAMAEKNAQLGQRLVDMEERENKRRQEAGLEPIHKTRGKQLDSIVRDFFNDVGDGFRLGVSRMAKAQGQEVGQAVDEGYEALAELAFSSPSNFFMVLETAAPSLLASAVPATGFGRGASALSRAAVPANVLSRAAQGRAGARGFVDAIEANAARYGGATGLAAHMTASGANESARFIRDMPQKEIEKLPLYQDVVDQLGPEGAREHLAKLAVDTHLAAGAPLAALVTLGPARLRMNIIEDYLTGASKLNKTSGYLVGAALGLAKGSGAEFSQGFVDSLSQDLARYSGGLIRADEIGEQALASALLEVISTGPGNAAFGSLQVRQARNLREANQVLQDHLRRARQEVGDNEARRRADPSEVAGNDDAEVLIGEVAVDDTASRTSLDTEAEQDGFSINDVPDSVFIAFPEMTPADSGLLPLTAFSESEQEALRRAGLVETGTLRDGSTHEGVYSDGLWVERQRRAKEAAANKRAVSDQEKDEGVERRAAFYERTANQLEQEGDAEKASELRERARKLRSDREAEKRGATQEASNALTAESWDGMTIKAREEVAARTGMVTPSGRPNAAARRLARKPFAELTAEERARLSPVATERRADTDTRARIESLPEAEQQTEIQRLRAQVEEQQRQLDTDPLTTVRSVRALNRDIMDGVQATRVYRTGGDEFGFLTADGSVGAIDLDLFKVVNDTIGHAAGDTVLRTVGEILNKYEGDTRSAPEIAQAIQQELDAKKITLDKFDENGNFVQKYEYDGIAASVGTADPSVGANESDPAAIAKARRAAADAASKLDKQRRTEQGIIEERGSKTSRRIRPIGPPAAEEGGVLQGQLPGVADVQPVSEVQDAEAQASDVVDQAVTVRDDAGPAAEPGKAAAPEPVRAEPDVATEPETEAVGAEGEGTPEVSRPIQRRPAREERKDESPEAEARRKKRIQDAIDKLKNPKFLRRLNALNRALKASGNSEVTLTETPAELKPLVDRIAKLFGVDIIFVRSDDWNGVNVSPDAIFISDTATDPFVQVMGHELVHAMRRQNPELYQALVEAIRPLMKDKAFASRLAAVRRRARTAKEVAGDKATEEVMADVVGEIVLSNPSMLAGVKPNLIQRVLNFIRKWFDTILKGKSDETYHDVYAAREAVAAILDSWADRTDAENRARVADMGPMFSRRDHGPFYSALSESVEQAIGAPKRASSETWKGWLDGAQRRGEFKQSERDWLGIDAWLDAQDGPVTREAMTEFVRANEVQVQDVVLDDDAKPTKFRSYRVPGGENYRELLLTLPPAGEKAFQFVVHQGGGRAYRFNGVDYATEAEARAAESAARRAEFKSTHWDQPNVLAHIRFDERTDADGKRVLFLNEVQSDWHQEGRKKGYASGNERSIADIDAELSKVQRERSALIDAAAALPDSQMAEFNRMNRQIRQMADRMSELNREWDAAMKADKAVPNAPLKGTDQWAMLAFKRMARWAVDNGFDRIAWTTGEQAAEMFDLSKQIDHIDYRQVPPSDDTYDIAAVDKDGHEVLSESGAKLERIEELVGKEIAQKIANGEGQRGGGRTTLRGLDLKVGGEGMRGFYDKILPAAVSKWGKKFGARAGKATINATESHPNVPRSKPVSVHAIDITPSMREAVQAGQPMFSRPDPQDPKAMQAVISKKAIQAGLNPRAFPKVKFVPSRENMPSKKPGPFLHEGVVYIPSDITPEAAYAGLLRESVKLVGYRNLFNDTQGIDALLERSMQNDEIRDKAQGLARANNLDWPTLGNIQKLAFIERALSGLAQDNSMRLRMQFRLRKALGVSTDLAGSIVRDTYKVNKVAAEIAPSKVKSPTFDDIVAALPKRSIGEMVRSMFEGAADKLIRGRGTKALGLAIRKYVDLKQSYDGMISSVMRKPLKALTDSKRFGRMLADPSSIIKEMTGKSSIETEFDRWAGIWVENEEAGNKVLNTLSPEARAIAEAWMKIADLTGKEMVKQGVEVAETYVDENGRVQIRHRPLRQVKRFMPRMLHERFEQAIQDPLSNPEAWQEVVGILIRNGVVLNEQAAYEYVHKKKTAKRRAAVTGDFMANMELARSEGWPAEMYDYSLRSAMTYLTRWSDRMAQIRAFGQKHKEELFDQTLSRVASSDRRTKDYLSKLQKIIYRDRSLNEGWFYRTLAVLNQLATGLLLGNPGTATLNLIGGSTLNNMAYGRDAIKAYWNLVREFKHINAEMHELGMVSQDFLSLIHDYDSDPQSWLATFVTKTMKYGGYTPTERIIRAHAYVSAKHKLNRSLRAWAKGFDSRESRREAAWAVREGFNPFDLMRDFRENGDLRGEHIDAYLRKAVNLTQGSYKLDQVPLFTDDPIGRFLFKFQKFGTQLSRMFHRHHLVPFMESLAKGGEKVAFVDSNGKEVSFRARNFVNMLTYFGMAVPGGLAVLYARAAAFGYDLPVPDWEEIDKALEDEELGRAFGLAMDMTFQSLIAMGGIGILQTPAVAIKDFSEQRRVPQPTNPPALNSVNQVMGLYWTLLEQGRITGADLQRFVEQTFSGYRNYQRGVMSLGALAGVESDAVRSEYARRNIREVQRLARRYADEQGIGEKRRRAQGFGVSPQTPINRAVVEQLYLDNPGQARAIFVDWLDEIAKEHVGKPGGEERIRAARSSLQSFIRVRQPTIVNTKPDDETRREFLVWAEKNLSARQWNLIKSMDETYRSNARKAFGFLEENERRLENQRASRERVLTQNRVDELKKQWGLDWRSP